MGWIQSDVEKSNSFQIKTAWCATWRWSLYWRPRTACEFVTKPLPWQLRQLNCSCLQTVRHHVSVQTEEEAEQVVEDLPAPSAPKKKAKGSHIPKEIRELMNSFPRKVRVLSIRGVRRLVLQIYMDKVDNDQIHDEANHERLPMAQFIGEFMYHKYGLHTLTDYHLT